MQRGRPPSCRACGSLAGPRAPRPSPPAWKLSLWIAPSVHGISPCPEEVEAPYRLGANPAIVVHLESGNKVVIVEGTAEQDGSLPAERSQQISDAYAAKYESYRPESAAGLYVMQPRVVCGWHNFPADVTRWRFDSR